MAQQISDNPYLKDLGLELLSMENGTAEVGIRLREEHMNSWQVMHGGIIMTLLDACMARAARSLVPELTSAATVDARCETSTIVLPLRASCRDFKIAPSFKLSKLAVGSSKRSRGASCKNARASPSRCRSPPESVPPSSPTGVS